MQATPLQRVTKIHGSKKKLVDLLAGELEKREGEGQEAFKKRLASVSCAKLLKLHRRIETQAKPKKAKK